MQGTWVGYVMEQLKELFLVFLGEPSLHSCQAK